MEFDEFQITLLYRDGSERRLSATLDCYLLSCTQKLACAVNTWSEQWSLSHKYIHGRGKWLRQQPYCDTVHSC